MRFAILGLYNSGSTALAGMLHRLGANMGPPFWATDDDQSESNFYEPRDLSENIRHWYGEPHIGIQPSNLEQRIGFLKAWIKHQENLRLPAGAKHPLLSLCGHELITAWGANTQLIWAYRDFDASVRGLERRGWFRGHETATQQRLWTALHELENTQKNLTKINWDDVRANPMGMARNLASLTGITPSDAQLTAATSFVKTG